MYAAGAATQRHIRKWYTIIMHVALGICMSATAYKYFWAWRLENVAWCYRWLHRHPGVFQKRSLSNATSKEITHFMEPVATLLCGTMESPQPDISIYTPATHICTCTDRLTDMHTPRTQVHTCILTKWEVFPAARDAVPMNWRSVLSPTSTCTYCTGQWYSKNTLLYLTCYFVYQIHHLIPPIKSFSWYPANSDYCNVRAPYFCMD